jgi:class 3 adenylate cyclase
MQSMTPSRILLVDDTPKNLSVLASILLDAEPTWDICTAGSADEAKEHMRVTPPDIVVTDLVMDTDQCGMEVLQLAKSLDPLVMVILVTSFGGKLDRAEAFKLGAYDCIQRPTPNVVYGEEVVAKVRLAIHHRDLAMRKIRQEQQIGFLKRYFDPVVWETLVQQPGLLNPNNRIVTVSFWDIRGFSRLCEILKAHPELVSAFLKEYLAMAAEVIFANGGVLDKFIGDGVMGLFGALGPYVDEGRNDAINAIQASIDCVTRFNAMLPSWLDRWRMNTAAVIDVGVGCGIHTGDVVVGNLGTEFRDQFTALGPTVNLAQRIESGAQKSEIRISASTHVRAKGRFAYTFAETLTNIKNIPEEVQVYRVAIPGNNRAS